MNAGFRKQSLDQADAGRRTMPHDADTPFAK
jgi:hypothetical protein